MHLLFSIAQELLVTDRHLIQAHMVVIKINKINKQLGEVTQPCNPSTLDLQALVSLANRGLKDSHVSNKIKLK